MRRRRVQNHRIHRQLARSSRISWLRRVRGHAADVARGGPGAAMGYGGSVTGLPPRALRARRRLQAAASLVKAKGSSLTARLAIGGGQYAEADPAVLEAAPPSARSSTLLGISRVSDRTSSTRGGEPCGT